MQTKINTYRKNFLDDGLKVTFKYTASRTPQQNERIERKLANLFGRVRAIIAAACIEDDLRKKLWAEGANTCANLYNILVNVKEEKPSFQKIIGSKEDPRYIKHLISFRGLETILNQNKIKVKMTNRGKKAIMIGYVRQNNNDTYRMYNLETGRVILTRDTRSTGISYGKLNNKPEERDDDRSD